MATNRLWRITSSLSVVITFILALGSATAVAQKAPRPTRGPSVAAKPATVPATINDRLTKDLQVENCVFDPASPKESQRITVTIDIRNSGNGALTFPVNSIACRARIAGEDRVWKDWISSSPVRAAVGVAAGAVSSLSFEITRSGLAPGAYTLMVEVDPGNAIQESNEANNSKSVRFTVLPKAPAQSAQSVQPAGLFDKFKVNPTDFDWLNCDLMIACNDLADKDEAVIKPVLKKYGFSPNEVKKFIVASPAPLLQMTQLTGYGASRDDMVLIVIRGTDPTNVTNWLLDASFVPGPAIPYSAARDATVHSGFYAAANSFWSQGVSAWVQAHARTANGEKKKIFLTGFSLGAPIAALTAARLQAQGEKVQGVYLFACPNVGNAKFASDYNQRLGAITFRTINRDDPIPRLPLISFQSVGNTLYWIDGGTPGMAKVPDDYYPPMVARFTAASAAANYVALALLFHHTNGISPDGVNRNVGYWPAIEIAAIAHRVPPADLAPREH